MHTAQALNDSAAREWGTDLIRLSVFTTDLIKAEHCEKWWQQVVQADPEEVNRKPALAIYTMSGPVDGLTLNLGVAPGRLDGVWWAATVAAALSFGALGLMSSSPRRFGERLNPWLQMPSVSVVRVAVGLVASLPTENKVAGYRLLSALLPAVKIDVERS